MDFSKREKLINYANKPIYKNEEINKKKYYHESCDDNIMVEINKEKYNGNIYCEWNGSGCFVLKSSAEFIANNLNNLNYEKAISFLIDFDKYINNEILENENFSLFDEIRKHISRRKCVMVSINGFLNELKKIN